MRPVPRALLAASLGSAAVLGPGAAALAAGSGSITTAPTIEAWYQAPQACLLPAGCAAAPPSPYAADTLHVGVLAGQEESRTFLQLGLSALPSGTKPAGGQLLLPVAKGSRDGSRAPETARLRACSVTEPVEEADGELGTGPEVDCEAASVEAVHVPATGDAPAALTVDLAALAAAWTAASVPGALALLPAEDVGPGDSWHVAFSDRTRSGEGVARITAAVSYVSSAVDVLEEPPPPVTAPIDPGFVAPPSFSSGDVFAAPGPVFEAPGALLPVPSDAATAAAAPVPQTAPQQQAVVPVATVVDAGFRYPGVFLLPLLLAAAAGWLGRALTRDLTEGGVGAA